jgi:hypothetical protein
LDIIERDGSGYVGKHGADFLFANDSWSQIVNYRYGPDGSVHAIDWYDKNQCHSPNPDVHDKTLGRIFKISYKDDKWVQVDLQKMTSLELVALQLNKNDWYVRHARRLLQERGPDSKVHAELNRILRDNPTEPRRLRVLWALHVTGGLTDADLIALLSDKHEAVRSWAVQLLAEDFSVPEKATELFATMALQDSSSMVRLYLASALQRTTPEERWDVLAGLYTHAEDADDHNLPLMIWYAAEPTVIEDMDRGLQMALDTELPNLLRFTVQRIAAEGSPEARSTLARFLEGDVTHDQQLELLRGLNLMIGGTD